MNKVSQIFFRARLRATGLISFDGGAEGMHHLMWESGSGASKHENCTYAKSTWRYAKGADGENKLVRTPRISKDAIKASVYAGCMRRNQADLTAISDERDAVITEPYLLRGYLLATKTGNSFGRKSPVWVSQAEVITGEGYSPMYLEVHNNQGRKEGVDTSFFFKEVSGENTYEFEGVIDIEELRMLVLDDFAGRLQFDPNGVGALRAYWGPKGFDIPDPEFYYKNTDVTGVLEHAIEFDDKLVRHLIDWFFTRLVGLDMYQNQNRASLSDLEIACASRGRTVTRTDLVYTKINLDAPVAPQIGLDTMEMASGYTVCDNPKARYDAQKAVRDQAIAALEVKRLEKEAEKERKKAERAEKKAAANAKKGGE